MNLRVADNNFDSTSSLKNQVLDLGLNFILDSFMVYN